MKNSWNKVVALMLATALCVSCGVTGFAEDTQTEENTEIVEVVEQQIQEEPPKEEAPAPEPVQEPEPAPAPVQEEPKSEPAPAPVPEAGRRSCRMPENRIKYVFSYPYHSFLSMKYTVYFPIIAPEQSVFKE